MSISKEQFNAMLASLSAEDLSFLQSLTEKGKGKKAPISTLVKVKSKTSGPIRRTCKYNYHSVITPHVYHCNLCGGVTTLEVKVDVLSKSASPEGEQRNFQVDSCSKCRDILLSMDKVEIVERIIKLIKHRSFSKELPTNHTARTMNEWLADQPDEEDYVEPVSAVSVMKTNGHREVEDELCPTCFGPMPDGCVCVE